MRPQSRRQFLADVGRGMLIASVGSGMAFDLGLASVRADEGGPLSFGSLEPMVCLMQETPVNRLLPVLVEKLRSGTELKQLVSAAALANARTFGGEDYVGFHTLMALSPAYAMARELPDTRRPLPVFKVLYRNTNRIQEKGGRKAEVLKQVAAGNSPETRPGSEIIREAVRRKDVAGAEKTLVSIGCAEDAFNELLPVVQDATEVHRVVLVSRAWDLLDVIGMAHAYPMLRQSVRYCVRAETPNYVTHFQKSRDLLPKLFDQYRLAGRDPGRRQADDGWIARMSETIFKSTPEQAADAAAAALAEGMAPDAVGEAISVAANQLVLRDAGRPENQASAGKPPGSIHGDSIGVHACDSANAWRSIAKVSNTRNAFASLILGAFQVSKDRSDRGGDFLNWTPYPRPEHLAEVKVKDADSLLREAETAIKGNDQARTAALVHRYGELGHPPKAIFDLMLRYAVSEDGALHAEKYYRTVSEEFASTRAPFRWRQLTALARVTASEHGKAAPGYAEACELLKLS